MDVPYKKFDFKSRPKPHSKERKSTKVKYHPHEIQQAEKNRKSCINHLERRIDRLIAIKTEIIEERKN